MIGRLSVAILVALVLRGVLVIAGLSLMNLWSEGLFLVGSVGLIDAYRRS